MPSIFEMLALHCRKITLNDYHTKMRIGAYDHERLGTQPVSVTAEVWVKLSFGQEHRLSDVYDYAAIAQIIERTASARHIDLQEDFADRIISALMKDPRVAAVRVRTAKPMACEAAESVAVETFRLQPLNQQHP